MIGFIVRHGSHLGKILEIGKRSARILYTVDSPVEREVSLELFRNQTIRHTQLVPGLRCQKDGTECCIICKEGGVLNRSPIQYRVRYINGLSDIVSETDLTPICSEEANDPLSILAGLNPQGYPLFAARERFVEAFHRITREGSGFRALLSSRIDLMPHQAFVAGVVLMDIHKRYILADEVGLGKTIEAGIIIHDLLSQNPSANVLILSPGSLVQQWLCEIYSKFGGQVFRLIDIRTHEQDPFKGARKVIISTNLAVSRYADELLSIKWDLVVIDEVHHLLASPPLYRFASCLSQKVLSLLLLSAIPAQKREDEFMRLLALLEPDRYRPDDPAQRKEFKHLYASQADIGRRVRILSRRVEQLENDMTGRNEVVEICRRLLQMPVLETDDRLRSMVDKVSIDTPEFILDARRILRYVADRYRINRRILKNRRQHLVENGHIQPIQRKCVPCPFQPDQLEIDCSESIGMLLKGAAMRGLDKDTLIPLARTLFQSMAYPPSLTEMLVSIRNTRPQVFEERSVDPIISGELTGYSEWEVYRDYLCSRAKGYLDDQELHHALDSSLIWARYGQSPQRIQKLVKYLKGRSQEKPLPKIIIFAGFPGMAQQIASQLFQIFGEDRIAVFLSDLTREEKEENALNFQRDPRIFMMISDETGGEGRNFQFASEIIHFDLPWYAGRIEQRIGRLDRLGREKVRSDVLSVVIYNEDSVEAGLFQCYEEGFKVFTSSISGLEFALREVEKEIVSLAITGGRDLLSEFAGNLSAIAEQERALDESEALSDVASFDRSAADRFQRVLQSENSERVLEKAFVEYFQMIATNKSAVEVGDQLHSEGVWQFTADNTLYGILPMEQKDQEDLFGTCKGTFRRDIARQTPYLDFFNIGNPFFDAVVSSLKLHHTGRVYAIDCKVPDSAKWGGFEFIFSVSVDLEDSRDSWGLANQARSIFTMAPVHLFVNLHGKPEPSDTLRKFRLSLQLHDKGRTWWNLTKDSASLLLELAEGGDWQGLLYNAYQEAHKKTREYLDTRLSNPIKVELQRLSGMKRRLEKQPGNLNTEEIRSIENLASAVENWRVELDAVGFLGINLGLR